MSAVLYPTVLLGLGRFGREVVETITRGLEREEPLLATLTCPADQVGAELNARLEPLLRAGGPAGATSTPRLDLFAFALALQGGDEELLTLVQQAAHVVGEQFGALFPRGRPPGQRTAGLHLVVAMPPMAPPQAERALERLRGLEAFHQGDPPYPLLSRIWLLSLHSESGTHSGEDLTRSAAAFALGMVGAGLREADPIAARIAHHPHGEGLFSLLAAASLDLPKARLREHAAARARYDGLATLVNRVEQAADPNLAGHAIQALGHEAWLEPFESGEPARRCQALAVSLSGGGRGDLPARIRVEPFDSAADLQLRYAVLFEPATRVLAPTQVDVASLEEMIRALDKAESAALLTIQHGIDRLFGEALGPSTGLRSLPQVEAGLRRLLAALEDAGKKAAATGATPGPSADDPLRAELDQSVAALPSRWALARAGLAAGFGAFGLALVVGLGLLDLIDITDQSNWTPFQANLALGLAWGGALLFGVLVALLLARLLGSRSRVAAKEALEARKEAITDLWRRGGGGLPGQQAQGQLRQRRMRVRRGATIAIGRALEHLEATRNSLVDSRDAARQVLVDQGVPPQSDASLDDLSPLLGELSPLHAPLAPARVVSAWVHAARRIRDPQVWADRLLEGAWPGEGLLLDHPCANEAVVWRLARVQTAPLVERHLFMDPEATRAVVTTVAEFARRAPVALARPVVPRDPHGESIAGLRGSEVLVIAPVEAREALDRVMRDEAGVHLDPLWTAEKAERVLFVRTWEGFSWAEIARGAGIGV